MRKKKAAVLLICALLMGLLISSCANKQNAADVSETGTKTPAISSAEVSPSLSPSLSPSPSPSPASAPSGTPAEGFAFEEKTYADGSILIKYPQITGLSDSGVTEVFNSMISSAALRDVKDLPAGTEYELVYTVTLNTPAVLSLYFEGYAYVPDTVHPYAFLRAVTIDVAKQELVRLPSLLNAIDGVADVIFSGTYSSVSYEMSAEYETAIKENLNVLNEEFWLGELRNADTELSATISFLTKDALVISVSVPHVMGDHVEIYLPFKALAGYQTDNSIWQEIDK